MSLQIIQARPNPAGKMQRQGRPEDREEVLANPLAEHLFREWVDIKNVGAESVHFSTIQLRHTLFDMFCYAMGTELYWAGGVEEYLKPGQVLRIHAGREIPMTQAQAVDCDGADWHGYTGGENFILHVSCGDKLIVSWRNAFDQSYLDWVCYAPHPPEDVIIQRTGNLLSGDALGVSF